MTPIARTLSLSLPADLAVLAAARQQVERLALPVLGDRATEDLALATGEALANAAKHGCGGDVGQRIQLRAIVFSHLVRVVVSDPGEGFDPDACAMPDPAGYPTSGFGVGLMRTLAGAVWSRGGSRVTLRKRAERRGAAG